MRQNTTALRVTNHFLARLKERLPDLRSTEGELASSLAKADWYAGGGNSFYALTKLGARQVVFVVALSRGLADLVTCYEPKPGWDNRLPNARPWPFALVTAFAA